ncbi:hypothetical protein ACFU8T_04665 [Sphingobacterium spiritivorum]|uniref:Uncharacterized protein n=1 Tax=Sphingobacterium spiritivorum ATCC 33861 TaxID=525373 RepID=D7VQI1_SPHSI|nr:hypothetical protein [Sphingobacterium spiritivorum]EFK56032.1 hypothetical protein HMPREF0766_13235 [Sphingobacterium spiritivorum ATCC 33861]QQT35838.1 hypothetical protein I6J01_21740 [Sphingobacterium spiritivorum]WQD32564.1 hypothetical protein U0038_13685 [Sphingobacterium spiritivorum]SUJ11100.1 Uncharacterised protein [Sphingobacterium spiritivorum]
MAQNAIRRFTLLGLFLIICNSYLFGQVKYFIIEPENEDQKYDLHTYKLATKTLYGIDNSVELYNIVYINNIYDKHEDSEKNLILFSVLPNLEGGSDNWKEISLDTIQSKLLPIGKLKNLFQRNTMSIFSEKYGEKTKYFNEYKIVIKKEGKYFTPYNCLLQFYAIRNRSEIFSNVYGTINTKLNPVTVSDFELIFESTYPKTYFPIYTLPNERHTATLDRLRDRREYLSKKWKLKDGSIAFQFWTYTDWHEPDFYYEYERGIDRFVYIPDKGIVGGSFDFYFYYHRQKLGMTTLDFKNNIRKEKVMLAEEYKH